MILIVLGIKVLALDVDPRIAIIALDGSVLGANRLGTDSTGVPNITTWD